MIPAPVRPLLSTLLLAAAASPLPAEERTWHFTTGQKLTAHYLWVDQKTLYLEDAKGKEHRFPVGLLANADLEFVRGIRDRLRAQGVVYEAPRTWQSYHSRNVKALDAERAGVYPLGTQDELELEFTCFGATPRPAPGLLPTLRLTTARNPAAGTNSTIRVVHQGKVVGTISQVRPAAPFDIPLAPSLFARPGKIALTVTCGNDAVHIRSGKSGAGPRLLIVEQESE